MKEIEHAPETRLWMIARIWHGWTKPEDAKVYEKLLRDEIFPAIAARKIEGYRGAELFIRRKRQRDRVRDTIAF